MTLVEQPAVDCTLLPLVGEVCAQNPTVKDMADAARAQAASEAAAELKRMRSEAIAAHAHQNTPLETYIARSSFSTNVLTSYLATTQSCGSPTTHTRQTLSKLVTRGRPM